MDDDYATTLEKLLFSSEVMRLADQAEDSGWYVDSDNTTAAPFDQGTSNLNTATDNTGYQIAAQNPDQKIIEQDINDKSLQNSPSFDGHPSGSGFEPPPSASSRVANPEEVHSSLFPQPAPPIVGTEGEVPNFGMGVLPPSYGYQNNLFDPPAPEYNNLSMTEPYTTTNSSDSALSDSSPARVLWQGGSDSFGVVAPQQDLDMYNGFEQDSALSLNQPINQSVVSNNLDQSGYCEGGQSNAYNLQNAQSLPFDCNPSMHQYVDGSRFIQTPFENFSAALQDTDAQGSRSTESFNRQNAMGGYPQIPVYNLPPESTSTPPMTSSNSMTPPELWLPPSQVPIEMPAPELCGQSFAKHMMSSGKLKRAYDQFATANQSTCDNYHQMPPVTSNMLFDMIPSTSSYPPMMYPQAAPYIATHNNQLPNPDVQYPWEQTTSSTQMPTQSYAGPAAYMFGPAGNSTFDAPPMGQDFGQEAAKFSGSDWTVSQADKLSNAFQKPDFPFTFVMENGLSSSGPSSVDILGQAPNWTFELNPDEEKLGSGSGGRIPAAKVAKKKRFRKPQTAKSQAETITTCQWGGGCNMLITGGRNASYRSHLQEHHSTDFPPECVAYGEATSGARPKFPTISWTMKKGVKCQWGDCGMVLGLENLARHIGTSHTKTLCEPCTCGRVFSRWDSLRRHLVAPDPSKPEVLVCPESLTGTRYTPAGGNTGGVSEGDGFSNEGEQPYKKQRRRRAQLS